MSLFTSRTGGSVAKKIISRNQVGDENRHEKAGYSFFFKLLFSEVGIYHESLVCTSYQQALCCMILLEILTTLE